VYLLLTQWHLFDPETSSECSPWSWHLFLDGTADSGGFPPEIAGVAAGLRKIEDPCFPLTLPSPVIADDINDEADETLNVAVSFENSSSTMEFFVFELKTTSFGFVKSSVMLCDCGWTKLAGAWRTEIGVGVSAGDGEGKCFGSDTVGVWTGEGVDWIWTGGEDEEEWTGARLNRAWPVRLSKEMSFLNLETVWSVSWVFNWVGWWERVRIKCSMPLSPSDAASCMAFCSSIFGNPMSSTAIFLKENEWKKWNCSRVRIAWEEEKMGLEGWKVEGCGDI